MDRGATIAMPAACAGLCYTLQLTLETKLCPESRIEFPWSELEEGVSNGPEQSNGQRKRVRRSRRSRNRYKQKLLRQQLNAETERNPWDELGEHVSTWPEPSSGQRKGVRHELDSEDAKMDGVMLLRSVGCWTTYAD